MVRVWCFLLTCCLIGPVFSSEKNAAGFDKYLKELKKEAKEFGISKETLDVAFEDVKFREKAVAADNNQPEKRDTLEEYIPKAVPDWKVKEAKELYQEHYTALKKVEKEYGVPAEYIVALWGVESNFGTFTGNFSVINALATLAYDGRRETFFKKELMSALTILDAGDIEPENMKGSWAGAMGHNQFMPSTYVSYAADGDGDGKRDIWNNTSDVFASIANFLQHLGWDDSYIWGREVQTPDNISSKLMGRNREQGKTLEEWRKLGVTGNNGQVLPSVNDPDFRAWLTIPDGKNTQAYLVYNNYNVIMRWNRSYYFALAVTHFAEQI